MLDRPLSFVDMETTGLRVGTDRIVELAILQLSPDGTTTERVRRFNPGMKIPPEATAVHGIGDDDVRDESPFASRARSLLAFLEPSDLVGFNLRRFDLPMLLAEFRRAGLAFDVRGRRLIDVQMIFHREEPRDLGAAVRFYLDRGLDGAHSALGDIRATADVLAAQLKRYPHLPRDLTGLDRYCDEVRPFETEVDRWFIALEDGRRVFKRGKHRGRPVLEVAELEPDYLMWMLSAEDMDEGVRDVVRSALLEARPSAEARDSVEAPGASDAPDGAHVPPETMGPD
jgi:DNA polymerase-3 subunit epsilon